MIFTTPFLSIFLSTLASGIELDKKLTIDTVSTLNFCLIFENIKLSISSREERNGSFEKINQIVSEGADKLQFVTDFDQTLTKQHQNGVLVLNSVGLIFLSKQLPEARVKVIKDVFSKFNAVQFNSKVNQEQKIRLTNELSEITHKKLQGIKFDRREIEKIVRKYGPSLRDRTDELLLKLKNLNVPVVIITAGLSDVIEVQLNEENLNYDNIYVIGNRLKFNETMLYGFQNYENLINSFNKHKHLSHFIKTELFKRRSNIILMGDNVDDATMVRGVENEKNVLKIGFFYNQTGDSLETYKEAFDVVLNDDQTMDTILDVVKLL